MVAAPARGAPSFCTEHAPASRKTLCNLTNKKFNFSIDKPHEMCYNSIVKRESQSPKTKKFLM